MHVSVRWESVFPLVWYEAVESLVMNAGLGKPWDDPAYWDANHRGTDVCPRLRRLLYVGGFMPEANGEVQRRWSGG